MLKEEAAVKKAVEATGDERDNLTEQAARAYFNGLGEKGFPSEEGLEGARRRARAALGKGLESSSFLSSFPWENDMSDEAWAALLSIFDGSVPELHVPRPGETREVKSGPMAVAGLVGAVLGMLVCAPLLKFAMDIPKTTGMFLGAPLGAAVLVLVAWWLAGNRRLRRLTQIALTLSSAVDVTVSAVRGKGMAGALKRALGNVAVVYVLKRVAPLPSYDRAVHEAAVRTSIQGWLEGAVILLLFLKGRQTREEKAMEPVLREISSHIVAMHQCPADELPVAVEELIIEARNAGFEGIDGPPLFRAGENEAETHQKTMTWNRELEKTYETFGHIEDGDDVVCEQTPVVLNGEVLKRGRVRKSRRNTK